MRPWYYVVSDMLPFASSSSSRCLRLTTDQSIWSWHLAAVPQLVTRKYIYRLSRSMRKGKCRSRGRSRCPLVDSTDMADDPYSPRFRFTSIQVYVYRTCSCPHAQIIEPPPSHVSRPPPLTQPKTLRNPSRNKQLMPLIIPLHNPHNLLQRFLLLLLLLELIPPLRSI